MANLNLKACFAPPASFLFLHFLISIMGRLKCAADDLLQSFSFQREIQNAAKGIRHLEMAKHSTDSGLP